MATNGTLTVTQKRFLAALLTSRDIRTACTTAQVAERSAWRWLHSDTFRAELSARLDGLLRQATAGMAEDAATARATLTSVCTDALAPPSAKVAAAKAILEAVIHLAEFTDVGARLDALEARLR